jgi:hypothetical protein
MISARGSRSSVLRDRLLEQAAADAHGQESSSGE